MLKKLFLVAIFVFHPTFASEVPDNEAISCESEQNQCEPTSCLEQCIKEGEDPLECPYYCYDHV